MRYSRLLVLLSLVPVYTQGWDGKLQVAPLNDRQEPGTATSIIQGKDARTPSAQHLTCRFIPAGVNHDSIIVIYNGAAIIARPIPKGTSVRAGLRNPFWKYHDANPNVGPEKIDLGNYTLKEALQPGQSTAIERDFSSSSQYINRAWPCFVENIKAP